MRSGVLEADRLKVAGRQPLHRRKMPKTSPIVNGADGNIGYAAEEESMVRQVNLAAAYHDHISCTKSADLCKTSDGKEGKANLPFETDHIYANCSETRSKARSIIVTDAPSTVKEVTSENKIFRDMCLVQLELVRQLQEKMVKKDRQLTSLKQEVERLKVRLERRDRRMCLLRKRITSKSDDESVDNVSEVGSDSNISAPVSNVSNDCTTNNAPVHLVTRYFGRRSKTIPLRALKRRYIGPPKSLPLKKSVKNLTSSAASVSSTSEAHDEELTKSGILKMTKIPSTDKSIESSVRKKSHKKRSIRPKGLNMKDGFLTTDKAYYLPDNQYSSFSMNSEKLFGGTAPNEDSGMSRQNGKGVVYEVPSWKIKPVTSFYQMEGTENINDSVFQRRHLKCEQDERRRKRWDMQRLREQRANQKLKFKQFKDGSQDFENQLQRKYESFYPDPYNIEYIEVTDQLPVLAFGQPIPLFQPCEFSLPWTVGEDLNTELSESPNNKVKKSRASSASGSKVT